VSRVRTLQDKSLQITVTFDILVHHILDPLPGGLAQEAPTLECVLELAPVKGKSIPVFSMESCNTKDVRKSWCTTMIDDTPERQVHNRLRGTCYGTLLGWRLREPSCSLKSVSSTVKVMCDISPDILGV
jgi:hypothetical protein